MTNLVPQVLEPFLGTNIEKSITNYIMAIHYELNNFERVR